MEQQRETVSKFVFAKLTVFMQSEELDRPLHPSFPQLDYRHRDSQAPQKHSRATVPLALT
jgi:hypothetical protein